jgi:superfamily I DNA and/or RNA helicase
MARQGKKILVTAASNAATDHLLQQCIQAGVNGVRIGNTAKVEEDNQAFTMDACLLREKEYKQIKELKKRAVEMRKMGGKYKRSFGKEEADQRRLLFQEAKKLQKEARDWEQYLIDKIIDESAVVAATLIGSNHHYIQDKTWDVVVIDEAGQALGPAAWVAIGHAEKVVFAGDPHQLPPTVKSPKASELGLSKTLLDVAIAGVPDAVYFLNVQYRMHKDIMAFSNSYFYKDGLMAHESVADRGWSSSESAVVFVDTAGCGFEEQPGSDGNSLQNQEEWSLIQKHLEAKQMLTIGDVAVISPYRAQVSWIQNELAELPRMTVNTIDSFQGQEEDIVYISLVRSNENSEIGFLKDYRRMNVAMTRAKKGLIIVGDSATLAKDAFYSSMIEMIEKKGGYLSAWEILYS